MFRVFHKVDVSSWISFLVEKGLAIIKEGEGK